MNWTTLLFGVLPLIAFVLIDSFAGLKAGIISAVLFALVELAYTLIMYKKIDEITIGSLALVLVFGYLSYRSNNSFYFKIQPVVLGGFFGIVLLVMQFMDKPLLIIIMKKYQYIVPENMRAQMLHPAYLNFLGKVSHVLGWGFLVHAAIVAYAAFYLSNWWWLGIRGLGVYVMMFLCMFMARFI